jgi:hypothetical protein
VAVLEVKRLQIYNGYMCDNDHSPTETSARSGVTVLQLPWPLAKANGLILVWGSLTGVIPVPLPGIC